MNLIVFDLEWNIGWKPFAFQYEGIEQTLRGEIIQIGAVRMDEQGHILESFRQNLRPHIFPKLQKHIAKVTGMTQAQLDAGAPLKKGLAEFAAWCGSDAKLAEWGLDDVPVLKQNLFLNGLDESWPTEYYDLQRVFLSQHPRQEGEGMTLESVITRLGIPMERPFHDALSDATYTAEICQKLDLPAALAAYPDEEGLLREALLTDPDAEYCGFERLGSAVDMEQWRQDGRTQAVCPVCGAPLAPDAQEVWLERGKTGRYSLQTCPQHGGWLVRIKLARRDGLHWQFARVLERADSDKQKHWEKQKKQYLARLQKKAEAERRAQEEAQNTETPD